MTKSRPFLFMNQQIKFTRREMLLGGLGLLAASSLASAQTKTENPLAGENLFRDVQAYSNLGEHRTGNAVDLKTSEWIESNLKTAGFETRFQSFRTPQFFPVETILKIDGQSFEAFPLWFPHTTNPRVLRAPFKKAGDEAGKNKAHIALVKFPFDVRASIFKSSGHKEIIEKAVAAGAVGIVAVTESATGQIIGLNAMLGTEPWAIPIVCVGAKDAAALEAAASKNTAADLVLQGRSEPAAEAKNVIGTLNRGKKLVVVSTPQSGWFRCAGERGAGVAVFLGLAKWAVRQKNLDASFLFVSTSGHELGGLGMKAFLKEHAPAPKDVFAWLHLGAWVAAWNYAETAEGLKKTDKPETRRWLFAAPDLNQPLTKAFADNGLKPVTERPVGEVQLLLADGYRAFGLVGGHPFHHATGDLPIVTAPELLAPVAAALTKSFDEIFAAAK